MRRRPIGARIKVDFALFRSLAPEHQPATTLPQTIGRLRDGLAAMGFSDRRFREGHHIRLHVLSRARRGWAHRSGYPHAPGSLKARQWQMGLLEADTWG